MIQIGFETFFHDDDRDFLSKRQSVKSPKPHPRLTTLAGFLEYMFTVRSILEIIVHSSNFYSLLEERSIYPVQCGTGGNFKLRTITSPTYGTYPAIDHYYSRKKNHAF